jgi:hypothetical protein
MYPLLHTLNSKLSALLPLPWHANNCSPEVNPTKVVYRHHNGRADGFNGFKPATFQWILDVRKQKEKCKVRSLDSIKDVKEFLSPSYLAKLREERRLGVFENRVLRKVFGPKRDEVTGEWRKLHNKELNDLYSLPNIVRVVKSRRMRWAGHVACMGEDRGVHRVLVGKPEEKRPLGRPRCRWEDNIKMDLQEVGGGRGDWMELAHDRDRWRALVGTVRDFRVP